MWQLIVFLVLFFSPSYPATNPTLHTETPLPAVPENETQAEAQSEAPTVSVDEAQAEAPFEIPENDKIQHGISTYDDFLYNPKIVKNPVKVENFSKALAEYSTINPIDNTDTGVGIDKTGSFSTLSKASLAAIDSAEEPAEVQLERFAKWLSMNSRKAALLRTSSTASSSKASPKALSPRSSPKASSPTSRPDTVLRKYGSFSRSVTGSFKSTDDDDSDSDLESDELESLPSRTSSKNSLGSTTTDEGSATPADYYKVPEVISTPKTFAKKRKSYSAEDTDVLAAAINQNFWVTLKNKVYTASVTPYKMIRPPKREIRPLKIKGYKIIRMVTVLRHSIRLPTEDTIVEMKERLPELWKMLKNSADRFGTYFPDEMRDWKMYDELAEEGVEMKTLVRAGKTEARRLGKRFRKVFKHFLPEKFDAKNFVVKFTDCPRTKDTALSFMAGLYDELPEGDGWYEEVKSKESVLKYDSTCIVWKLFKKSDFNRYLTKSFLNSPYLEEAARDVAFTFNLGTKFNVDDLILVYETCSFEVAWRKLSPWCYLLTEAHMKVLEYAFDLELYILAGYANVMNTKIPCKLYNDLMRNLLYKKELKALFYVTHLTSILKLLAFLGLYQDVDIRMIKRRPRYDPDVENRNWRPAYIGAFNTNITFVLFEQVLDKVDSKDEEKKLEEKELEEGELDKSKLFIQVRHQERPVHIPMCPLNTELLCPLDTFEIIFERFTYGNCQFEEWCKEAKLYPPENNIYFTTKEYKVGKRRQKMLKKYQEAEDAKNKEAEESKEKDYRRIKSTGDVEYETALDKKEAEEMLTIEEEEIKLTEEEEQEMERKRTRSTRAWDEFADEADS